MSETLLSVQDLRIEYAQGAVVAVQDVSFALGRGEILGLVGESGSGKSSIGFAIMGHLGNGRAAGGLRFGDTDLLSLGRRQWAALHGRRIGMVYQEPQSALNPAYTIGEQISEGLRHHMGLSRAQARARALHWLEEVNLPDPARLYDRYPHQLSGGQLQRVVIAMTFALEPELVIMDEPTTGLDVTTQARIMELVARLRETTGVAILYISHDLGVVADLCRQVLVMYQGQVVEAGPAAEVLKHPEAAYTARLVASIPNLYHRQDYSWTPAAETETGVESGPGADVHPGFLPPLPSARRDAPVLLDVSNLDKTYHGHGRATRACKDVSFDIRKGEAVALIGESGSGKSTIAKCLLGLEDPTGGNIRQGGAALPALVHQRTLDQRRRIQIVFQNPDGSLNGRRTIRETLRRPVRIHDRSKSAAEVDRRVDALLDAVDLSAQFSGRYPHELSGGQKQRVAIARALASEPELIVCDEAVSALDVTVQSMIIDLCRRLQRERGVAFLFITHDLGVVRQVAERAIVLLNGDICQSGSVDALFADTAHPYVKELIASVPGHSLNAAQARDDTASGVARETAI
ncbi:MAG: ABC transporter ATP-binding protein [Silicimonas sp.]